MSDDQVARRVLVAVADAADDGQVVVHLDAGAATGMTLARQRAALDQLAAEGVCVAERGTPRSWSFSVRGVPVSVAARVTHADDLTRDPPPRADYGGELAPLAVQDERLTGEPMACPRS